MKVGFLCAIIVLLHCHLILALSSQDAVLVVGATGGTGKQVLNGLVQSGLKPKNLRVLSRDASKLKFLEEQGFGTVKADLNDCDSLANALNGCSGCYLHSTVGDTKELDSNEVLAARKLATAMSLRETPMHVVYNSAVGEESLIGSRKQQKRAVEDLFENDFPSIDFTSLRSNFFMDPLWKKYTRPAILAGKFTFCVPPDTPIHLTAVADMGFLAGKCLQSIKTTKNRTINVSGDVLTPVEIAAAFAKCQGTPCQHSKGTTMAIMSRLFFKSLWEEIVFLRKTRITTDIDDLKQEFGKVTSFEEFLDNSGWADTSRTYEDLSR
ncbi:unnamed protein product [Cylindrotheca closterium]|uniref:NmrA-like domain-containing protein n=1 Tax=Cylindrotheca closterium TaxID=2856 RepID=A0AAD2FGY1_9STRA|nr:unnamed protein product [Cylindrotheca closterium]